MQETVFHVATEATKSYFARLNGMLAAMREKRGLAEYDRCVLLGGKALTLHFCTPNIAKVYAPQFCYNLTTPTGDGSTLYVWKGDYLAFLPKPSRLETGNWGFDNEDCRLRVSPWSRSFVLCDKHSHSYYMCLSDDAPEALARLGHAAILPLNMWAKDNGLLVIHGAAVGLGGRGVLIGGAGGAGKSTLALSCLAAGMQFVSEDYLLLEDRADGAFAYPIYSVACLNPDMRAMLPELNAPTLQVIRERGDRVMMDISAYFGQFAQRMRLSALLATEFAQAHVPRVYPAPDSRAAARLIRSTTAQMGDASNLPQIRALSAAVAKLPRYTISLGLNLRENAAALERFLQEALK